MFAAVDTPRLTTQACSDFQFPWALAHKCRWMKLAMWRSTQASTQKWALRGRRWLPQWRIFSCKKGMRECRLICCRSLRFDIMFHIFFWTLESLSQRGAFGGRRTRKLGELWGCRVWSFKSWKFDPRWMLQGMRCKRGSRSEAEIWTLTKIKTSLSFYPQKHCFSPLY